MWTGVGRVDGVSKITQNMQTSFMDSPFKEWERFKTRCANKLLIYLMIRFFNRCLTKWNFTVSLSSVLACLIL